MVGWMIRIAGTLIFQVALGTFAVHGGEVVLFDAASADPRTVHAQDGAKPSRRHEDSAPPVDELKQKLLAGEYGAFDEIVFATRTMINEHWYANFGYFCASPEKFHGDSPPRFLLRVA